MHKYSFVSKPPESSGIFNGLLNAVISGRTYGSFNEALSFANYAIDDNPDSAPRGYGNPAYTVAPRASELDPTSVLAVSLETAFRRNPVGTVGYTHHHRAIEYLAHVSSMFAKWLAEFQTLYVVASQAQAAIRSGNLTRIDSVREVLYHDGDIEAFLIAVGSLNDGNISYPASEVIDVDVIYARVMQQLEAEIEILDNIGYSIGERFARRSIGVGTIPKTGQNVACLSAATFDGVFSSPWRRILAIPRSRDLVRERFMERYEMALSTINLADPDVYVTITEGDDVLFLPTEIDGGLPTWESLTAAIDARPSLNTNAANAGQAGCYMLDAGAEFASNWLNQFYTKGELVEAILVGDVDPVQAEALITVLANPLVEDETNPGASVLVGGPFIGGVCGTGALASANYVGNGVGYITGSHDVICTQGTVASPFAAQFTPLASGQTSTFLPNGILYVGDCAAASATSWIEILRFLRLNYPQEAKLLLAKSGRSKRSLPKTASSLSSFDALLSEALSNGQRDGYIENSMLAFNVTRLTRNEQEGPVFGGGLFSDVNPGSKSVSTRMVTRLNGWDRDDNSDGRYVVTPNGVTVNFDGPTPSRFTGEWDAGRYATWAMDFASEAIALGSGSVESKIASGLLSYPGSIDNQGTFLPRYLPEAYISDGVSHPTIEAWLEAAADEWLDGANQTSRFYTDLFGIVDSVPGYATYDCLESYHPTAGFRRGWAQWAPGVYYEATPGVRDGYLPCSEEVALGMHRLERTVLMPPELGIHNYPIAGYELVHAATTGAGVHMSTWMWDPTRSQILGVSWHRWSGHMHGDLLPHLYLPHPVAVTTASCRLSDLVGAELPNESAVGANLYTNTPDTSMQDYVWTSVSGLGVQRPADRGDGYADLLGFAPRTVVANSSTAWNAKCNHLVSMNMELTANGFAWNSLNIPVTPSNPDTLQAFTTFDMKMLTGNACSRSAINRFCTPSIEGSTDHHPGNAPVGTTSGTTLYGPTTVEGETFTPAPYFDNDVIMCGSLVIYGKGLLFEGDVYTGSLNDIASWMVHTYSGEKSVVHTPLTAYWAPWTEDDGFAGVSAPLVGCNFLSDQAVRDAAVITHKPHIDNTGTGAVMNDWFRKGEDISPKHARMRSSSLANPWVRAQDSSGIVHLRYDNSQIAPIYSALQRALLSEGLALQSGLTNTAFLEIQIAN